MKQQRNERGALGMAAIVAIAVLGGFVVAGLSFYGYANSLRSESVRRENALSAQYLSNQNYLSAYVSGFYEQLGLVKYKSEKLDQILLDYAKARSEKGDVQQAFLAAVVEAVPDLKGLDIADKMMEYVQGGRAGYRNIQDKMLDMIRSFNEWRQDGYVQSLIVERMIGVPTQRLEARIGTTVFHGPEALEKMKQIVLASQAKQAYETGVMDPLQVK